MARRPQKTRAARAGLARGLEPRRLRRNAGKVALSRLELGEGVELDRRGRLTTASAQVGTVPAGPRLPSLLDDTKVTPSDFRVSQVTGTTAPVGVTLPQVTADLAALQAEIEVFLEEIRENFATITKRLNELSSR